MRLMGECPRLVIVHPLWLTEKMPSRSPWTGSRTAHPEQATSLAPLLTRSPNRLYVVRVAPPGLRESCAQGCFEGSTACSAGERERGCTTNAPHPKHKIRCSAISFKCQNPEQNVENIKMGLVCKNKKKSKQPNLSTDQQA